MLPPENQPLQQPNMSCKPLLDIFTSKLKNSSQLLKVQDFGLLQLTDINRYLYDNPVQTNNFGLVNYCNVEDGYIIPYKLVVYGKEKVVAKIHGLLDRWVDWNPQFGGRTTTSQGAFVISNDSEVRIPDVAYTPREIDRSLSSLQIWSYGGEPFVPSFVVEVDTLKGPQSQLKFLDKKMRDNYFGSSSTVQLGWLIDPENKLMYEYKRRANGKVFREGDTSWRDLEAGNVLPGFKVESYDLDKVLRQESGSSDEEELVEMHCPAPGCKQSFTTFSKSVAHMEWHRKESEKRSYLQSHQRI